MLFGAGIVVLLAFCFLGLAMHYWNKCFQSLTCKLFDLYRQNLGGCHLFVKKFDYASQLSGYLISHKEHAYFPCLQVRFCLLPEGIGIFRRTQKVFQCILRIETFCLTCRVKLSSYFFYRPVDNGVGGIFKHLADYFSSDTSIAASLDLYQGGNGILIQK